uniref:hypothetical protein n=1 Tax=Arachnia propionica TaxID=1750 RepID=UPI0030C76F3A
MTWYYDYDTFVEVYSRLLVAVWTDDSVAVRLRVEPHAVAADSGLVIPDDVRVVVCETDGDSPEDPQVRVKRYFDDFRRGIDEKEVTLVIPPVPEKETQQLSREELTAASGGVRWPCCITPCCSCG